MKVFALSAFASVTCTLGLALVVWIDAAAQAVNPYAAATQREAEQAYQTGRFPELKGLTNSQEDQLKALKLCENYRGADGRICGEVVGIYMKQGDDAAKSKKQADDDVWIQSLVQNLSDTETSLYKRCMESFDQGNKADYASHCANRAKETIKSRKLLLLLPRRSGWRALRESVLAWRPIQNASSSTAASIVAAKRPCHRVAPIPPATNVPRR